MDNKFSTLAIMDVIDGSFVTVRGMRFDAEFNAYFTNKPGIGIEIDSQEIGPVAILVPCDHAQNDSGYTYILLDQEQLKHGQRSLYNEIIVALEVEALRKANNMPEYKWEVVEYAA